MRVCELCANLCNIMTCVKTHILRWHDFSRFFCSFAWRAFFLPLLFAPKMGEHSQSKNETNGHTFNGKITLSIIQMNARSFNSIVQILDRMLWLFSFGHWIKFRVFLLLVPDHRLVSLSASFMLSINLFSYWYLRLLSNDTGQHQRNNSQQSIVWWIFANHLVYSSHRMKWINWRNWTIFGL